MKNLLIILGLVLLISACQPEQRPIRYGEEKCNFCQMTVVDRRFGGEIVTEKGRVYVYDAVECMIRDMKAQSWSTENLGFVLTNTRDNPSELAPVEACTFLISEDLPSPMGENINPFKKLTDAMMLQKKHGGEIYTWSELWSFKNQMSHSEAIPVITVCR